MKIVLRPIGILVLTIQKQVTFCGVEMDVRGALNFFKNADNFKFLRKEVI